MLASYRPGFAVMSRDLTAYSFEDESFETCKRYCRNDSVIVEQIPYVNGLCVRFRKWPHRWGRMIHYDKYSRSLYVWKFQVQFEKEYFHRNGKIVYDPLEKEYEK